MNFVIIKETAINTNNVFSIYIEECNDQYELVISSNGSCDNLVRIDFDDLSDAERAIEFIALGKTGRFHESI